MSGWNANVVLALDSCPMESAFSFSLFPFLSGFIPKNSNSSCRMFNDKDGFAVYTPVTVIQCKHIINITPCLNSQCVCVPQESQ